MPSNAEAAALKLFAAFQADLLARADETAAVLDERDAILLAWSHPHRAAQPGAPQREPVCRHLDAVIAATLAGPARPIAEAARPLLASLRWHYGYPYDPRWPDLGERVGFAQVIGDSGLLDHALLHVGLTLLAPHTHYPLHAHPAIELYFVLSGTAEWQIGRDDFVARPAGSLILHPSNVGHAMRTGAEPLLALYVWRGDIDSPSVFSDVPAAWFPR